MKKLALFCVLLTLTACTPQPQDNYKEKVLEKREKVIQEIPNMHAAEEW